MEAAKRIVFAAGAERRETKPAIDAGSTARDSATGVRAIAQADELASAVEMARSAGLEIPTHPSERYTLFVMPEFYANGELAEHRAKYGDRFNLETVSGATYEKFADNLLTKVTSQDLAGRAAALVPDDLPQAQLEKLASAGVRFIRTSKEALLEARANQDPDREAFQLDTYAIMLLVRRMDANVTRDSSIYSLVSFYVKSHFKLDSAIAVDDYINAIVNNDVARLIKGYLSYRPAEKYTVPEYKNVAAALVAA